MATIDPTFDLLYAMTMPPAEAVAYFKQKGLKVSENWYDLLGEIHTKVFTVANCAKLDVLQVIRDETTKAMNGNVSFAEFQKTLKPILQEKGWWGKAIDMNTGEITKMYPGTSKPVQYGSPWRLKLIYDVNLQTSFMAGRRARQLENVESRPYWQRIETMDSRTRPSHRVLNGLTFRHDDPYWNHFYPPDAYRCRGRVRALSADQVSSQKVTVSNSAGRLDFVDVQVSKTNPEAGTVKVARYMLTPPGTPQQLRRYAQTDPGWTHAPGEGWQPNLNRYDADLVDQYRKAKK
jgi:SPP1 gp7 family putative phage head morphogenesis protein